MKPRFNDRRLGVSLIYGGTGGYLLILELVRLINYFAAELYALASETYLIGCFVCTILITVGIILSTGMVRRAGIVAALILGIVSFCFIGVALFYSVYLIPFLQHERFQVMDWLLVCAIFLAGILLVVWGWFNMAKRK